MPGAAWSETALGSAAVQVVEVKLATRDCTVTRPATYLHAYLPSRVSTHALARVCGASEPGCDPAYPASYTCERAASTEALARILGAASAHLGER